MPKGEWQVNAYMALSTCGLNVWATNKTVRTLIAAKQSVVTLLQISEIAENT